MSTVVPSHITAICPGCGRRGRAPVVHAGRRTRCPGCGEVFLIPSPDDPEAMKETIAPSLPEKPKPPVLVGVSCRVCQTRMSVPVEYVGRKVKCPDCGVATIVPPPPAPRVPDIPKAIFADQYEVFDGDEQPWGADLAARQPKLIPIHCRHCQTLMHGHADQVGAMLTCPDCGLQTRIAPPPPERAKFNPIVEAYDVFAPEVGDGENDITRAYFKPLAAEAAAALAAEPERPELPRSPLTTGVVSMLRSGGVPASGLVLSAWLAVAGCILNFALPRLGGVAAGKLGAFGDAMMGASFGMMGAIIACLAFAYFAALVIAIVTESSEGNDRLHGPPSTDPTDWYGEAITLVIALMIATAPGSIAGHLAAGDPLATLAGAALGFVFAMPVVLLSQLEIGSPLGIFSSRVLAGLTRVMGVWLVFTLQSLALAAVLVAGAWAVGRYGYLGVLAAAAPVTFAALLYFRLLGRLAWVVAERGGGGE